jgi:hypothetical protein
MNKTVYLRDDEVRTWEKARELSGDKLSPIIVTALKRFISEKEALGKGFERIEVAFHDADHNNLPAIKAFYGRWIIDRSEPLPRKLRNRAELDKFAVAETAKGNVVVYMHKEKDQKTWGHKLRIYPGFEEAAEDEDVNYAIRKAMERRGVPIEELDI